MPRFKIEGMKELQKSIKKLGKVPQKCVTPAARKGMNIAFKSAKQKAPVETGELKQGLKLVGEKAKVKGKKVYQVVMDKDKNDIFQKKDSSGKVIGYYPASQEYGFFARNGRYIPGYHFLRKSLEENAGAIERKIVDEMGKQIDKALEGK